jgi:phosphatidylinositol alpha-1,6-mannosyltransferase
VALTAHNRHVVAALLVSTSYPPGSGGIESYLEGLCRRLGPRLAVLAPARRDGQPVPHSLASSVRGYPGTMAAPSRFVARAVAEAAAAEGTERVLFGSAWPLALLGPRLRARGLRYATIVHGAELFVPAALPGLKRLLARALEGADLLLPVSRFTAERTSSLLASPPPLAVLRAHVDLHRFTPKARSPEVRTWLGVGAEETVILCLGRLVRRKGVHRLVEVLPGLAASFPQVTVVVAGTGPQERRLRRMAKGRRVVFTGRVVHGDAPALHASADVFVLPVADRWWGLDTEGLGVALLEAQASGVPCVTGCSGGTSEAVIHDETGFVIDARDRGALVRAISRLLEDPDAARRMGAAGREHVARSFADDHLPPPLLDWLGIEP